MKLKSLKDEELNLKIRIAVIGDDDPMIQSLCNQLEAVRHQLSTMEVSNAKCEFDLVEKFLFDQTRHQ